MNILYVSDTFLPSINGIVTNIVDSSTELIKRGHDVSVFTSKINEAGTRSYSGIRVHRFRSTKRFIHYHDFRLTIPNHFKMSKILGKIKPDVIHAHMPSLLGWDCLLYAKMNNLPFVATYSTLLPDFLKHSSLEKISKSGLTKEIVWFYTRLFYNRCDMVIAPSETVKKELARQGIKKTVVISFGVNTSKFCCDQHKKIANKHSKQIILHVGRLSYEKSVGTLAKAYSLVAKKFPQSQLLIIGDGNQKNKLINLTKKLGLTKNVKFLGVVEHDKLSKYYSSADIFASASAIETEGIVFLEAMACGLPIIGVNKMGAADLIKDGYNGLLAEPYNYRDLAEKMSKLLWDKKMQLKMSRNSLIRVKEYDSNKSVRKLENLYKKLISEHNRPK